MIKKFFMNSLLLKLSIKFYFEKIKINKNQKQNYKEALNKLKNVTEKIENVITKSFDHHLIFYKFEIKYDIE